MGSHSVTCYPAEVILLTLPWHSPVFILPSCGRWKAESLSWRSVKAEEKWVSWQLLLGLSISTSCCYPSIALYCLNSGPRSWRLSWSVWELSQPALKLNWHSLLCHWFCEPAGLPLSIRALILLAFIFSELWEAAYDWYMNHKCTELTFCLRHCHWFIVDISDNGSWVIKATVGVLYSISFLACIARTTSKCSMSWCSLVCVGHVVNLANGWTERCHLCDRLACAEGVMYYGQHLHTGWPN